MNDIFFSLKARFRGFEIESIVILVVVSKSTFPRWHLSPCTNNNLHTYPFPPCYLFTFTLICLNFPFIYEKWVICFIWLLACIGETGRGRSVLQASWGDNLRQSKTQLWRRLLTRLALKHSFPFPSPNLYTSKIKQTNHSLFFIIANRSEIQTNESERNMCVNYYYYKD